MIKSVESKIFRGFRCMIQSAPGHVIWLEFHVEIGPPEGSKVITSFFEKKKVPLDALELKS